LWQPSLLSGQFVIVLGMNDLFTRGVDEIIAVEELERLLDSGKKLRLKLGVDPSSPDIHLGHAVVLRKLKAFQDMGHTVIFLIGDATARIGDPSGRNKTRPVLDQATIDQNAQTYLDQVGKILDISRCEIRRNSEWLDGLSLTKLMHLAGQFTVAQLIERDDFKIRLDKGQDLGLHELFYPVMQAYDSVALDADVEFGGSDQRFNLLAGRALQKKLGQPSQQIFMAKLLVGTDGQQKMSKSLGNYIGVTDDPVDMYGKTMSIPDELIAPYYELCTDIELSVIDELVKSLAGGANPRDAKASLAREIVAMYHGADAGIKAEEAWEKQFRQGEMPADILTVDVSSAVDVIDAVVQAGLGASRSEVRRMIDQGGLRCNGQVVTAPDELVLKTGDILQAGKRRFVRLKII
jgi:tyrosyl-tRNA synthetase